MWEFQEQTVLLDPPDRGDPLEEWVLMDQLDPLDPLDLLSDVQDPPEGQDLMVQQDPKDWME